MVSIAERTLKTPKDMFGKSCNSPEASAECLRGRSGPSDGVSDVRSVPCFLMYLYNHI